MNNVNPAEMYSANFKTGSRTYFINLLEGKNGAKYVKITESRKVSECEYQKNRIMLFSHDLRKLANVLNHAIAKIDKEEALEQYKGIPGTHDEDLIQKNMGKPWLQEDKEKLEFLFKAGKTIDDLTEIFGRTHRSIGTMLRKLELMG